jgi:hypothetical protein
MRPRITAFVSPDHDLYHTSLFLTGLDALARRGTIALRCEYPRAPDDVWLTGDPVVVCFEVDQPRLRVAIDLRDGEGVSRPILDRVDRYFKRAFYPPELLALPPALAARVEAYGLNFGGRSWSSTLRLLRAIGPALASRGRAAVPRLRQLLATPTMDTFEQGPDVPLEGKVVFQTRLWTSDEIPPDEVEPLNTARVEVVRALRRALGDRFVGGLVPTPMARERYPADVTPHSSRYAEYLALKKRYLVSVYTRGVEHSLAFKLGETLAASQCLVSVALRYTLPSPLLPDRHYLEFQTTDECVDACQRLLDDPEMARAMRHANAEYYRTEVAPAAHVANILSRVGVLAPGSASWPRQRR